MPDISDKSATKRAHWRQYSAAKAVNIDGLYNSDPVDLIVQAEMLDIVQGLNMPGVRVLDVGCGTGSLSIPLFDLGYKVTGFDISSSMLERLKQNKGDRDINLIEGDFFDPPNEIGLYEIIVCRYVFSHYENYGDILASMKKLLVPDGRIVVDSFFFDIGKALGTLTGESIDECAGRALPSLSYTYIDEFKDTLDRLGLSLISQKPSCFFHRNPMFLGSDLSLSDYDSELKAFLNRPDIKDFVHWINARAGSSFGSSVASANISVISKNLQE